ncbi:DNA polymerase, partial [Candidatus Saccharibacteria bacterium]|nr:DNA polymerase [Candidatus Saccharibacteria bacterium]
RETFLRRTPGLRELQDAVRETIKKRGEKPYLTGIDGRKLYIRHEHAALNTLLQSAGALLVKQATINLYKELTRRGYKFGVDWAMVAHVHDEYQLHVREDLAEEVAAVAVWSFEQAGRDFNWRCPLTGEAKIGRNWKECH